MVSDIALSWVGWGSADELLNSRKVFTALKDESYQGRRLENAAWRLHAMQKLGKTPSFEAASQVTQGKCAFNKLAPISDQLEDAQIAQHPLAETLGKAMGDDGFQRVQSRDGPMLEDSWAAKHLLGVCLKNKLSNDAMGEILQVLGTLIDFSILQSRKKVKTDPQLYNLQLQRAFMW